MPVVIDLFFYISAREFCVLAKRATTSYDKISYTGSTEPFFTWGRVSSGRLRRVLFWFDTIRPQTLSTTRQTFGHIRKKKSCVPELRLPNFVFFYIIFKTSTFHTTIYTLWKLYSTQKGETTLDRVHAGINAVSTSWFKEKMSQEDGRKEGRPHQLLLLLLLLTTTLVGVCCLFLTEICLSVSKWPKVCM